MRSLVVSTLLLLLVVAGPAAAFDDPHDTSGHSDQAVTADSMAVGEADHGVVAGHAGGEGEHQEMASAHGESTGEEEEGGVMEHLAHHLLDANSYDLFGYSIALPVIKGNYSFLGEKYAHGFQITKHMIGLIVASLLAILLLIPGTRRSRRGEVPHGFGNFLELLIIFVRDEVVYPNMGKEHGRKWLPFFLTLFFLILFSNLLGMIPWGTTPTGNVNVTAGLAIATLLGVFFAGIKEHGFKYLGTFIPHGVPWYIIWLLFPIEIFGLLVKHFALTIRLFANMLAGHTVIGVFLALILTPFVAFASVPGAVAISMLELFVAFLQSYIFVMLGSLFVGTAIHPH
jgi:F-type H+-transporting ATPase subunit a